jgi:hypothetical protein
MWNFIKRNYVECSLSLGIIVLLVLSLKEQLHLANLVYFHLYKENNVARAMADLSSPPKETVQVVISGVLLIASLFVVLSRNIRPRISTGLTALLVCC